MLPSLGLQEALRTPVFEGAALALGLIVGSFANVCIHRLPRGRSVVSPPSGCPSCGALIRPGDNIPVLSYLILRGRCRSCRARISARYPIVEAANGLAYLGLAVRGGPTTRTAVEMVLVSALLVLSLIDLDHHLLPNLITRPGIALGLAASFLPGAPVKPLPAAAAALGGYLTLFLVALVYRGLRHADGLGQGDWKMVAMLGAFLGWQKMLLVVFLATLAGTLVGLAFVAFWGRDMRYALPLGTFLGVAGIVVVFTGDPILAWYGGFFHG
ncbi:MAG TPA: prepilin peptidase [Vicinamibacteria bacterium]|nr:prepilin peptidase [Vicinamibacteria bacterium]